MCGIAGAISLDRSPAPVNAVETMGRAIAHRGPDGAGSYVSEDGRVAFAHRRLAIIDLSPSGRQPMVTADGRFAITYNGEIYNYLELRRQLLTLGATFVGTSDTEVILEGYRYWGADVLRRLRGMFAFAIHDVDRHTVLLARDRLGIKPLYIADSEDRVYFCSEVDPIIEVTGSGRLDRLSVAYFLKYRYIPGTSTVWQSVNKLAPGEYCEVALGDGTRRHTRWWDILDHVDADAARLSAADAMAEALDRMQESVSLHMRSDVPFGVLLSGGLDSTSVLSLMRDELRSEDLAAFTMGFGDQRDEGPLAAICAAHFAASHHTFEMRSQLLDQALDTLAANWGEPLGDSSAIPFDYLSSNVVRRVKVVLGGDGGDELFGGYRWYGADRAVRRLPAIPFAALLRKALPGRPRLARLGSALGVSGQERLDLLHGVSFTDDELRSLIPGIGDIPAPDGYHEDLPMPWRDRVYDLKTFTVNSVLHKVDVASMAHGLEVRVPFLDHELLQWSLGLPPELLFNAREGKILLRRVMKGRLPEEIFRAPKLGFSLPLRSWSGQLMQAARDLLPGGALIGAGLVRGDTLRDILDGRSWDPLPKCWSLIVLEKWLSHRSGWL